MIYEISAAVPKKTVKNMDLTQFSEREKLVMVKTTGIEERRQWDGMTSELAIEACKPLDLSEIDMIVCVSQTPDYPIPGMSHLIQNHFKLKCGCIDINGACNGFIQGLAVAANFVFNGYEVLLVFAEKMTAIMEETDKNSMLFGDAAVAMVLNNYMFDFRFFSDGSKFDAVCQKGEFMKMQGETVFDFTMTEVLNTLKRYNISEFDYFIPHQSNLYILKQFQRRLNIPDDQMVINIQKYGNTSACSIPLAMVTEKPTGWVLVCGYGAGLNWGIATFNYEPENIYYNEV